jgi:hypothetical protein
VDEVVDEEENMVMNELRKELMLMMGKGDGWFIDFLLYF